MATPTDMAPAPPASIDTYNTTDVTPLLSLAGTYAPLGAPSHALVEFYGVVKLGLMQKQGVLLGGWSVDNSGKDTALTPVNVILLDQKADGTLQDSTSVYLPSPKTNGEGSVNVADFNGDGLDDIFLGAHNESPMVPAASTAYLSKSDGTFTQVTLADTVQDHAANLAIIGGVPTVLGASFAPAMPNPIYTYDGKGNFNIDANAGMVSAMSVAAADFLGDGHTEIVYGDELHGVGVPYMATNAMQQYLYHYEGGQLVVPPIAMPAPYFNGKPQYASFPSNWDPYSKSHNSRLFVDDLNQDGMPDIVVGVEIWDGTKGLQKNALQILLNQGGLKFLDATDALNPDFAQNSWYDYSLRMVDVDGSGIKTYLLAQSAICASTATGCTWDNTRQGNYILVNDGSGRLHVAMHEEFVNVGAAVAKYAQAHAPAGWSTDSALPTPRLIAYQTPSGELSFVGMVSGGVGSPFVRQYLLVNVPLAIDLRTQYQESLTILNRNGSHHIRTFAGNDTIYSGNDGGHCSIDGGLGMDTVVYSGPQANYSVDNSNGSVTVTDKVGSDGTDTLTNIETLQFSDGTMPLN
ncbi:MAG: hypothetical protein JWP07_2512 [Pseudonocardiales bacterium]|nr:hypothetical protein [Pseudonocardiales bacterium]